MLTCSHALVILDTSVTHATEVRRAYVTLLYTLLCSLRYFKSYVTL